MKYKNFPQEFWKNFESALNQELKSNSRPTAAFDADGTLWDLDLGEDFFQWQIQHCAGQFKIPMPEDPWDHYRNMKASGDPRPAYLWLAQINQGLPIEMIQAWAEQAVQKQPLPIFPDQKKLIEWLQQKGVEIFVITASVKWAVEAGTARLGIPADHVLGVATTIENGLITTQQDGTITYREGKIQALLEKTKGLKPFLSCGNTMGDIALLENSTQLSLAVGTAVTGQELFETEEKLREQARQMNWLIHQF